MECVNVPRLLEELGSTRPWSISAESQLGRDPSRPRVDLAVTHLGRESTWPWSISAESQLGRDLSRPRVNLAVIVSRIVSTVKVRALWLQRCAIHSLAVLFCSVRPLWADPVHLKPVNYVNVVHFSFLFMAWLCFLPPHYITVLIHLLHPSKVLRKN